MMSSRVTGVAASPVSRTKRIRNNGNKKNPRITHRRHGAHILSKTDQSVCRLQAWYRVAFPDRSHAFLSVLSKRRMQPLHIAKGARVYIGAPAQPLPENIVSGLRSLVSGD